jgi:glyoxylase-like metal-dependent hydrolase (beta-lactamase superfamily II)
MALSLIRRNTGIGMKTGIETVTGKGRSLRASGALAVPVTLGSMTPRCGLMTLFLGLMTLFLGLMTLFLGLMTLFFGLMTLSPTMAFAQQDFSKVEIKTIQLGQGLAMLQGAGGNIGVSVGPDGVFLIDDQYAPLSKKIRTAIRVWIGELAKEQNAKASRDDIRFVLNTHWHGDHTGGNENLGESGALIIAHDHVRDRLRTEQFLSLGNRQIPAAPKLAWPILTFDEGVTFHLNGHTIEAIHVEAAHTDGDAIVYFHESDVLHMGDTYFAGMYPFIDTSSGGGIDGMIAAANRGLAIAGTKTRIIPGHGPLSTRRDLEATRDMLVNVRDRVLKLLESGHDRDQVVAEHPTQSHDEAYGGGFMKPGMFTGIVYDSLAGK